MEESESTLLSRLKRYADMTGSLSGSAIKVMAQLAMGHEVDHVQQAKALTEILGRLKGPVMKIAQMLATIPDALPGPYTQEFLALQADAPPMGWPFVRRRMQMELGATWEQKFQSFERTPRAAASLGQVHYAIAHDSTPLACKLQYPDMQSIVEADLNQLKLLLKLYEKFLGALKTQDIFDEVTERLFEELDYHQEARHMALYAGVLEALPFIHVPQALPELSTQRLLTMTWLEGKRLKEITHHSQDFRNKVARHMFIGWYQPFYQHGVLHGDPHLGNYTFRDDGSVNLLDFGCVRHFPDSFIKGVLLLYKALATANKELAAKAYQTWGFQDLTPELIDVLNLWANLLYEPLLDDRVRAIQRDNSGTYGRDTAEHVHSALSKLGGIRPPKEFVFMDRAAVGVGSVCLHLKAELNWHELFHQVVGDRWDLLDHL